MDNGIYNDDIFLLYFDAILHSFTAFYGLSTIRIRLFCYWLKLLVYCLQCYNIHAFIIWDHPPVNMHMTLHPAMYPRDHGQVCPALLMLEIPTWGKIPVTLVRVAGPVLGTLWRRHNTASSLNICISWHGHREWRWRYIFDDICLERLDCCLTGHIFNIHITWWKVVRRLILLYTAKKCRFGFKNCFVCWCTFRHILQDDSDIFPIAHLGSGIQRVANCSHKAWSGAVAGLWLGCDVWH